MDLITFYLWYIIENIFIRFTPSYSLMWQYPYYAMSWYYWEEKFWQSSCKKYFQFSFTQCKFLGSKYGSRKGQTQISWGQKNSKQKLSGTYYVSGPTSDPCGPRGTCGVPRGQPQILSNLKRYVFVVTTGSPPDRLSTKQLCVST